MDRRHPGSQDTFGDVHVDLDSSAPCWNDGPPRVLRAEDQSSKTLLLKRDLGLWIAASAVHHRRQR
jgi:hypothetical protein